MKKKLSSVQMVLGALSLLLFSFNAHAVPSYARQTNLACAACHTIFPELTPFGRSFKLNGYTLTGLKGVEAQPTAEASGVKIGSVAPMAAMLQVNASNDSSGNTYNMPGEFSLFFAGEISPKMGSFVQMTMEQGTNFEMDNADIRFATHKGDTVYGVTVNNSPTVQDLWNSTPVWGYPFTGGAGLTQPLVADGLGQNVMGIGAYAQMPNGIYAELSVYQPTQDMADPQGTLAGDTAQIQENAPYARLAWEKAYDNGNQLMVGLYGLQANVYDTTGGSPGTDKYTDTALDSQYELHLKGGNLLTLHGAYISENRDFTMSPSSGTLNSYRLDAVYHWGSRSEAMLAYANNTGAVDEEAVTAQYSYLPWQNTKLTAQYVHYQKGGGSDTALLQAWLMW